MSFVSGRIGRTLAAAAAIVAVAASLTLAPTATAGAEADGPHYQEPTVGQCRNYTMTAAVKESNSSPAIACSSTHTARTIAVAQMPASLTWSSASYNQLYLAMGKACHPALDKALGRSEIVRQMSAFSLMWFTPTPTQREHGARWIRCDVVRLGGQSLLPILKDSAPMLPSAPLPNAAARCIVGDHYLTTVCAKPHQYRASKGFTLTNASYPGDQGLYNIAKQKCPSRVSTPRNWYATWPGKLGWKLGDRVMVCYSHRSN